MTATFAPDEAPCQVPGAAMGRVLDGLNEAQQAAVTHELSAAAPGGVRSQPLLIVAGAGTGKTSTLAARMAALVLAGADPQRMLLLAFSRRAAQELSDRAGRLLHRALALAPGVPPPVLPWAGTFHGVAARLIREHALALGLAENWTLLDRADAEDLMGQVREQQGLAARERRAPRPAACLAIYSRAVNSAADVAGAIAHAAPHYLGWEPELARLFTAYDAEKRRQQLLDYDDLLALWAAMLEQPVLARALRARWDHVLVDEYQDTNRLQAGLLFGLCPGGAGLTVVGDDAQAIYGFRAADVANILDFPAQCGQPARVLLLERNYRSSPQILAVAHAVIAQAARRHAKQLWTQRPDGARPRLVSVADEAGEATWVARETLRRREEGLALKRQAVLFRTATHAMALELELARRQIPYRKFGGLKFLEAAHVKDVLALLRWGQNPRCELAAWRVLQLLPGLGPAGARRMTQALCAAPDPLQALPGLAPAGATALPGWLSLRPLLQSLWQGRAGAWPEALRQALDWYRPHLQRLHEDDAGPRWSDLVQLLALAPSAGGCERFLAELTLDPPGASSDEAGVPSRDDDYLILSTIHSAKGLEWPAVTLLRAVDGCIPSDLGTGQAADIEEERRLLHVALTRARDELDVMLPLRFHVSGQPARGDRHVYGAISRFLPPSVQALFERVAPFPSAAAATATATNVLPAGVAAGALTGLARRW